MKAEPGRTLRRAARAAGMAMLAVLAGVTGVAAQGETRSFLALYESLFQKLYYNWAEAEWAASTDVSPEHDAARVAARKAFSAFAGDAEVIRQARRHLDDRSALTGLQARQLEKILLAAAESPGTIPEIVAARVEAESRQSSTLDGFTFCRKRSADGCAEPISANEIDQLLASSRDLGERLEIWNISKEIGPVLKDNLDELRRLRNAVAREMGHGSFFALQIADYGMSVDEMMEMLRGFIRDIDPLYREIHCWTKHVLAERYGQPVPLRIPAHWLGNRWAQSWPGIVEGVDMDALFASRSPEWIVKKAEEFYVSMGFPPLPESFWERSDLYPVPEGSERKKNTHASAWHLNVADDIRSLMSVAPTARWFTTAHHELGHIYYYIAYTRPEVPLLLREGANRAFHEGIGEQIGIAALQVPYLVELGLMAEDEKPDPIAALLNEALTETVPFIPWAAGTISHWEHDLYEEDLPVGQWNARWWEYAARFQGIEPPAPRDPASCDACTKTHVNDDPAQYYDYAIATVLKYQLHEHIARVILKADPRSCSYRGSRETGDFLRSILEKGATQDWREVIVEATGSEISTKPMLAYFEPLLEHLRRENEGRDCSWE